MYRYTDILRLASLITLVVCRFAEPVAAQPTVPKSDLFGDGKLRAVGSYFQKDGDRTWIRRGDGMLVGLESAGIPESVRRAVDAAEQAGFGEAVANRVEEEIPPGAAAMVRLYGGGPPKRYFGPGFVFHTDADLSYVAYLSQTVKLESDCLAVVAGERQAVPLTYIRSTTFAAGNRVSLFSGPRDRLPASIVAEKPPIPPSEGSAIVITDVEPSSRDLGDDLRRKMIRVALGSRPNPQYGVPWSGVESPEIAGVFTALLADESGRITGLVRRQFVGHVVVPLHYFEGLAFGSDDKEDVERIIVSSTLERKKYDVRFTPFLDAEGPLYLRFISVSKDGLYLDALARTPAAELGITSSNDAVQVELKPAPPNERLAKDYLRLESKGAPPAEYRSATIDEPKAVREGGAMTVTVVRRDASGRERFCFKLFSTASPDYYQAQQKLKASTASPTSNAPGPPTAAPAQAPPVTAGPRTTPFITPVPASELK